MSTFKKDVLVYRHLILILVLLNAIILQHAFIRDKHWYPMLFFSGGALLFVLWKEMSRFNFFKHKQE